MRSVRGHIDTIRRYFSAVRPLGSLVWRASPLLLISSIGLMLLTGILPTINILIFSALLEALVQETQSGNIDNRAENPILELLLVLGLINLCGQLLGGLSAMVHQLHQTRVTNSVQLLIASKAAEVDIGEFEDASFHNVMINASSQAAYRPKMMLDRAMSATSTLATIFSVATMLSIWHWWIVPIMTIASLVFMNSSVKFGTARVRMVIDRAEHERRRYYLTTLLSSDYAAKEIRLFGIGNFLLSRVRQILNDIYRQDRRLSVEELKHTGFAGAIRAIVQTILISFVALEAAKGEIGLGDFSLYTQSIIQLDNQLMALMLLAGGLHEDNLFVGNLFAFLNRQPAVEAKRYNGLDDQAAISPVPSVEFQKVSFQYEGSEHRVLQDLSFEIHPGEAIALVGGNGAGKTTLVKLLVGLYEPTQGRILLDGVDIRDIDRTVLRSYMSVVFQDFTVYHFSARENIGVGQMSWLNDFDRIQNAARRSGFDRVASTLPQGYETVLGRFWESGHELSGGQRQLVALARALLREAPILVLDEPSSSLDITAEQRFFQSILEGRESGNRQTVFFISHRFSTVRRADRILVFDNGRLCEEGSHRDLMAQNGHYAKLFEEQASIYGASADSGPPAG